MNLKMNQYELNVMNLLNLFKESLNRDTKVSLKILFKFLGIKYAQRIRNRKLTH